MPSIAQISLAAALATTGLAAPATKAHSLAGFTVPRVSVPRGRFKKSIVEHRVKTLNKLGVSVPAAVQATANKHRDNAKCSARRHRGSSGSVPANSITEGGDVDIEYLSPVTVGKNVLMLDFDTGSSDLWVYSTLQDKNVTAEHSVYNVTTGKELAGETWNISYADNSSAVGVVYADKVAIGTVTAASQAVEAATMVSEQFLQDTASDGLVGFAFDIINTIMLNGAPNPAKTWFSNIRHKLPTPHFAAALKHGPADPGSYDIGYINPSHYQGTIQYQPVDSSQGFWAIPSGRGSIILDTGTTLAYWYDDQVNAFYNTIQGSYINYTVGGWVYPCSTKFTKDFPVQVGRVKSAIEAQYLNYGVADLDTPQVCVGALQSADQLGGFVLLGDTFLKGKYVVFGYDSKGQPEAGIAWQRDHGTAGSQ